MTPDFPVFTRLTPLLPVSSQLNFIAPKQHETLESYADRMSEGLSPSAYVVGVSFGGLAALEICRKLRANGCVLISSIRRPSQLPPWFRMFRGIDPPTASALLNTVGYFADRFPDRLSTKSTIRLRKLSGSSGAWHRWATTAVLNWKSKRFDFPILQIHGDADTTFPIRYVKPDVRIKNGKHALPISHPKETADAILAFITAISCERGRKVASLESW